MLTPPNASARSLFEQGVAALKAGSGQRAMDLFNRALVADPSNIALPNQIGGVLISAGLLAQAEHLIRATVQRFPNDAGTLSNLGTAMANAGRMHEAGQCWLKAVQLDPNFLGAKVNLAALCTNAHRFDDAEKLYCEILARDPNKIDCWMALAKIRFNLADLDDAYRCFDAALRIKPDYLHAHCGVLFSTLFDDKLSWDEVIDRHVRWGKEFVQSIGKPPPHTNDRSPDRRLRVGYVSPFFHIHVNTYLSEPILRAHDRTQFEVFAYCVLAPEKSEEALLQPIVDHWRRCDRMNDDELAATIRKDQIDILVDLTSHMDFNRLGVFARKPAPIQINYLAYPATSGLPSIDYRVTCPLLDPPGSEHPREPEKLLRLPDTYWCYPTRHEVPIGPPPSIAAGHISFGCLNALAKVREPCLRTWAKILDAVPGSTLTLLVKGAPHTQSVMDRLARVGLDPARVIAVPIAGREQHLDRFNSIDVALDTFPYGGHTTTHDALWMGVPVIAMKGCTPVSRAGECILSHVGLSDLVATDPDDYIARARRVAADLDRRVELRKALRTRMMGSPLCDAKRFTQNLERGFRTAWKRWCEQQAAAHIEVRSDE